MLTPRAQKEIDDAWRDLIPGRFAAAQEHLNAALRGAPGSATIHFLIGMSLVWDGHANQAKPYFQESLLLDPAEAQSLLALAILRYRDGDYAGAIELLDRAVQHHPSTEWQAHRVLASAYLRLGNFAQAREHASRALELGRENARGAQLSLAQALAGQGEHKQAAVVLNTYLQQRPQEPNAKEILGWIARLEGAEKDATPIGAVMLPSDAPGFLLPNDLRQTPSAVNSWVPPDLDASVPPVVPGKACILTEVLSGAAKRAVEVVTHLEKFSAVEHYESVELDRDGQLINLISAEFDYLVFIHHYRPGLFGVEELREQNRAPASLPGHLQDGGSPGVVLIFHPNFQDDFSMECEGQGHWNGQAAWLVHFRQRPDRPVHLRSFVSQQKSYPMRLRGRAWISAVTFQIVHLETELLEPIPAVQFRRERLSVDYQLVPFPKHKLELWLPRQVDLYYDFGGHPYHHYHGFTDFRLFTTDVETQMKTALPEKQQLPF